MGFLHLYAASEGVIWMDKIKVYVFSCQFTLIRFKNSENSFKIRTNEYQANGDLESN